MSTAFNSFKKDSPKLTDTLGQSVKTIRENFYTSNEVYSGDHFAFDENRSQYIGKHQKVTLANPTQTAPATIADECVIFPKKADYKEGGTTKQGTFPALKNEIGEFFLSASMNPNIEGILSENGNCILPNGLMINWGYHNLSGSGHIRFSTPFSEVCYGIVLNSSNFKAYSTTNVTISGAELTNYSTRDTGTVFFIALGR